MTLAIAMAQINPTVGALVANSELILANVNRAKELGADLIVFPEMALTGYPVEDLALRQTFQVASKTAIENLAAQINGPITAVVGYLDNDGAGPLNAVAIIENGRIKARYIKCHLPNYGVFDEYRNFIAGSEPLVFEVNGHKIGVAICEDIWQFGGPVAELAKLGVQLVVVPNGSPYERNKDDLRLKLVKQRAKDFGAALAYVNMVGGQDELVFDGDSILVDQAGTILARTQQFVEELVLIDLFEPKPQISEPLTDAAEIYGALVLGLRDYINKNGFKSVVLGLSGGIDSALVAAIAVDALGPDRVHGVALPSKYSSEHSLADAKELANRLGLNFRIIEIEPMVKEFIKNVGLSGVAEENVQARVRGTTLMGISNQEGHLVLATGNKSELAVGYSTLYGDAVGAFAPIKDVYKTEVWQLAKWRNSSGAVIPENSISKEPSAELRPGQKDSDSLPDYLLLDQLLVKYVDQDAGAAGLLAAGFAPDLINRVIGLVDRAEYKRRQYPPGPKVSMRAFGKDRRLPITSRWKEQN